MAFWGKSQKELDEYAQQLNEREKGLDNREAEFKKQMINREAELDNRATKREAELKNRESKISMDEANIQHERDLLESAKSAFAKERSEFLDGIKRTEQQIAADNTQLESRRQEIVRLESEAKANFARVQEETFKEVIEKRNAALDARKAELDKLSKKIAADLSNAVAKEGEIAKRELAVTEREQRADAGFADKATALAAENERQCKANQQYSKQLKEREEALAVELQNLETAKEALRQREQKVAEAERHRDAGYADLRVALDNEINTKRTEWQNEIDQKRKSLIAELSDRKNNLFSALDAQIEEMRSIRFAEINEAEEKERVRLSDAAREEAERLRTSAQKEAEKMLDSAKEEAEKTLNSAKEEAERVRKSAEEDAALKRKTAEEETARVRKSTEEEVQRIRNTAEEDAAQMRNSAEEDAARVRNEIQKERTEWDAERQTQKAELKKQNEANEKKESELSNKEDELNGKERDLELRELRLETQSDELETKYDELEKTVEYRVAERKKSFDMETEELKFERARLSEELKIQNRQESVYEQLKRQLGDKDPEEVIRELHSKADELNRLREELATRPTDEMRERNEVLEAEVAAWKERAENAEERLRQNEEEVAQTAELSRRNNILEADVMAYKQKAERMEASANEAQAELKRLRAAYEHTQEEEDRKKEIEQPHIEKGKFTPPVFNGEVDEMDWLKRIYKKCDNYGLKFNKRILKAFHTAVKTAEWSPLTVLAGVSGTGKSELPKLYSHFGGLLFEMVSVQPNWDSQESMLGFFNSIDNKFDAQPVLHFLAQSQKEYTDEYPGLKDAVCMILLDEMNLAHPELYFAEFLSKLENRRGKKGNDVPDLDVKIGAGMKPYKLPLGRNVLWTGTMNQDETTKSLSDKVLDRSIIIHFPRPTELKRRQELKPLDNSNRAPLLHRKDFFKWFSKESPFSEEQIKQYKEFIEQINGSLSVAGRAIGHRVWQSVEYYMANYPDVRAVTLKGGDENDLQKAMHKAFEDQLVQKVMPKLRGIDTRGKSRTDCLDKIRGQLNIGIAGRPFNLNEDFDLACELGYGQFIWMSANYLNNEEEDIEDGFDTGDVEVSSSDSSNIPIPDWFSPGDPNREEIWRKLPQEKQESIIASIEQFNSSKKA